MIEIIVCALIAINVLQYYVGIKERKDLLNRIMSKNLQDYTSLSNSNPPRSRSFLNIKRGSD